MDLFASREFSDVEQDQRMCCKHEDIHCRDSFEHLDDEPSGTGDYRNLKD